MPSRYSSILFYSLLVLACWIPLPFSSKSYFSQDTLIILISALSALTIVGMLFDKQGQFFPGYLNQAWLPCLLLGLYVLFVAFQLLPLPSSWLQTLSPERAAFTSTITERTSAVITFDQTATQHNLLLSFAYLQLFCLTLVLVNTKERLQHFLFAFVIAGIFQAAYGSFMTLSGLEMVFWFKKEGHVGVATGTLVNRNHLANYLAFCSAASIGLLLATHQIFRIDSKREFMRSTMAWLLGRQGFLRLSLLIMVVALVLTRSRMGSIAFFLSLTTSAIAWMLTGRRFSSRTLLLFVSLVIIDIALMGSWFGVDKVVHRLEATGRETELRVWETPYLFDMAKHYLVAGSGSGTFAGLFPMYSQLKTVTWYNEAHCDYLQFIIENGVMGCTPLVLLVMMSLYQALQTLRQRHSHLPKAAGFTALMGMLATLTQATTEYTLQRPGTATMFIFFLTLPWIARHLPSEHGHHTRPRHRTAAELS